MASSQLRMIPAAKVDLQSIWHYTVQAWGEKQAELYIGEIQKACLLLTEQSGLGNTLHHIHDELRVYRCQHHFLFYILDTKSIIFVAFLHERMDMLKHLTDRMDNF